MELIEVFVWGFKVEMQNCRGAVITRLFEFGDKYLHFLKLSKTDLKMASRHFCS